MVWLQIAVKEETVGKLQLELFRDLVPKTAENFQQLCVGIGKAVGVDGEVQCHGSTVPCTFKRS